MAVGDEQCRTTLNGEPLVYRLRRDPRRRRRLALMVSPCGEVEVRVPVAASQADIDRLLSRHGQWLLDRRERALCQPQPDMSQRYSCGASFFYLGERCQLRLREGRGAQFDWPQRRLVLGVSSRQPQRVRERLLSWLRQRAAEDFVQRLAQRSAELPWPQSPPPLRLRAMRSRWGSCSQAGICLNTRLIQAPVACIDMVIIHELCHLQQMNHSPAFYALMDAAMPDWRQHSRRLDELSFQLLTD